MASERCGVDGCPNTLVSTPNKMFITVPSHPLKLHKRWAIAMGIDFHKPPKREMYCCEDHFDLPNDVQNFKSWKKRRGIVSGDLLKSAVVPHHFPRILIVNHVPDAKKRETGVQTTQTERKGSPKIRIRTVEELRTHTSTKTFDNCVSVIKGPSSNGKSQLPSITSSRYRECAVPMCLNNLNTSPDMYFVCPPLHEQLRRKWYTAIGRSYSAEEIIYICSEHFEEEELELFRVPVSRLKQGPVTYQKRARHGVVPSLKLGTISVENGSSPGDFATDARVSVIVQRSLRSSKNNGENESESIDKYIAKALPQLPNCEHSTTEEFQCSKVSLVDYSTFYSNFYGLNSREKQEKFIISRVSPHRDTSRNENTFKFFIDSKKMFGREIRNCVCTRAFSCVLSLDIEILNSLLTCHFPPEETVEIEYNNDDAKMPSSDTTKDPEQDDRSNYGNQDNVIKTTEDCSEDNSNIRDKSSEQSTRKRKTSKSASVINTTEDSSEDNSNIRDKSSEQSTRKRKMSKSANVIETTEDSRKDNSNIRDESSEQSTPKRKTSKSAKRARKKSPVKPIAPTQRVLRSRRPKNFSEKLNSDGQESSGEERGVVSEDSDNDSDYTIETRHNNGRRSRDSSTSESSNENINRRLKNRSFKIPDDLIVTCGICKSVFSTVNALSSHHQLSNCCGKNSRDTVFACGNCNKTFVSQTALDVHRARNKKCSKPVESSAKSRVSADIGDAAAAKSNHVPTLPSTKNSVSCDKCKVEFTPRGLKCHIERSNICNGKHDEQPAAIKPDEPSNDGFQHCKKCKVQFSSLQGLRIHWGRSTDCQQYILANPDVAEGNGETIKKNKDIDGTPSDKERNERVAPNSDSSTNTSSMYDCKNCHAKYSSSISLIHHLKRSPACKLKNPRVYFSSVLDQKRTAEKVQPRKPAANAEESKEVVAADSDSSTNKSTDYFCRNCHLTYRSSLQLGQHLERSAACILKNPHIDILGVLDHNKIVEEVKGSKTSENDEGRNDVVVSNTRYYCKNCNVKYSSSVSLGLHLKRLAACILKNPHIEIPGVMSRKEINDKLKERLSPGTDEGTKKEMVYVCKKCFSFFSSVWGIRTHQRYSPECKPDQLFEVLVPTPKEEAERWKKDGKITTAKEVKKPLDNGFVDPSSIEETAQVDDFSTEVENHLKCTICYRSFDSERNLNCHVKLCRKKNRNKFICASCYKVFTKRIDIITHMQYSHYGKSIDDRFKYQCPKCPRKFMSKEDYLSLHEKAGCENEEIICSYCGDTYAGAGQLKEHVNLCHSSKINPTLIRKPLRTKSCDYTDVNSIDVSEIKMEP